MVFNPLCLPRARWSEAKVLNIAAVNHHILYTLWDRTSFIIVKEKRKYLSLFRSSVKAHFITPILCRQLSVRLHKSLILIFLPNWLDNKFCCWALIEKALRMLLGWNCFWTCPVRLIPFFVHHRVSQEEMVALCSEFVVVMGGWCLTFLHLRYWWYSDGE